MPLVCLALFGAVDHMLEDARHDEFVALLGKRKRC
jgi:hypothetical protein